MDFYYHFGVDGGKLLKFVHKTLSAENLFLLCLYPKEIRTVVRILLSSYFISYLVLLINYYILYSFEVIFLTFSKSIFFFFFLF